MPGVRVLGSSEDLADSSAFDHLAELEHDHAVGDIGDDTQVVGDQQDAGVRPGPAAGGAGRGSRPAP